MLLVAISDIFLKFLNVPKASWRQYLDEILEWWAVQRSVDWEDDFQREPFENFWHECESASDPSLCGVRLRTKVEYVTDYDTEIFG